MENLYKHTGRTFSEEELKDRAANALKLNGFNYSTPTLFPISPPTGNQAKPTILIMRPKPGADLPIKGLKGASATQDKLKRK